MTVDYHRHLDRWQASSHPRLAEASPAELFDQDTAGEYDRRHRNLWHRIMALHGTLRSLEELEEFPLDFLYVPGEMQFWRLVFANFYSMACIQLHGLANDSGAGVHSIDSFRDWVVKRSWGDEKLKEVLQSELKLRKFDEACSDIRARVKALRHYRLAHTILEPDEKIQSQLKTIRLDELFKLFDKVHGLFGALSFGGGYVTLVGDLMPSTVGGKPTKSCLSGVLDAVVRDSWRVNEPERNQWWIRPEDPAWLEKLNLCRRRIGLPEV